MYSRDTPSISVVMSVYQEPLQWITQSINSILNQSFQDFELIIINDCPTRPENAKLLDSFSMSDNRIKVIENVKNLGLPKSLNKGLAVASGKYIARMDADDISDLKRFEIQYEFMELHRDVIATGSCYVQFDNDVISKFVRHPESSDEIKAALLFRNVIAHPTAFLRREVLTLHNISYSESMLYVEDLALWHALAPLGAFHNIQQPLLQYRQSKGQISTANADVQAINAYELRLRYYRTIFKLLRMDDRIKAPAIALADVIFSTPIPWLKVIALPMRCNIIVRFRWYYFLALRLSKIKEYAFLRDRGFL